MGLMIINSLKAIQKWCQYLKSHLRPYEATFLDGNGNVYHKQTVFFMARLQIHLQANQEKDANLDVAFKFEGWESYQNITSDVLLF